jgi:hypothetical protein
MLQAPDITPEIRLTLPANLDIIVVESEGNDDQDA